MTQPAYINNPHLIPYSILVSIFAQLEIDELVVIQRVCKHWRETIQKHMKTKVESLRSQLVIKNRLNSSSSQSLADPQRIEKINMQCQKLVDNAYVNWRKYCSRINETFFDVLPTGKILVGFNCNQHSLHKITLHQENVSSLTFRTTKGALSHLSFFSKIHICSVVNVTHNFTLCIEDFQKKILFSLDLPGESYSNNRPSVAEYIDSTCQSFVIYSEGMQVRMTSLDKKTTFNKKVAKSEINQLKMLQPAIVGCLHDTHHFCALNLPSLERVFVINPLLAHLSPIHNFTFSNDRLWITTSHQLKSLSVVKNEEPSPAEYTVHSNASWSHLDSYENFLIGFHSKEMTLWNTQLFQVLSLNRDSILNLKIVERKIVWLNKKLHIWQISY